MENVGEVHMVELLSSRQVWLQANGGVGQQARNRAVSRVKTCQQAGWSMLHWEHVGGGSGTVLERSRDLHPCHGLLVHMLYGKLSIMLQGAGVGTGEGGPHVEHVSGAPGQEVQPWVQGQHLPSSVILDQQVAGLQGQHSDGHPACPVT